MKGFMFFFCVLLCFFAAISLLFFVSLRVPSWIPVFSWWSMLQFCHELRQGDEARSLFFEVVQHMAQIVCIVLAVLQRQAQHRRFGQMRINHRFYLIEAVIQVPPCAAD